MATRKKASSTSSTSNGDRSKDAGPDKAAPKATGTNQNGTDFQARSLAIASAGIQTGGDFANMMSALMSDLISGSITPQTANAVVNAGGKLLKITELQLKYGQIRDKQSRELMLTSQT